MIVISGQGSGEDRVSFIHNVAEYRVLLFLFWRSQHNREE